MLRRSITKGVIATTRLSVAAVVHVVQPRLEPPATKNFSTSTLPAFSLLQNAVTVSIARTAALVIGRRSGHFSSPVRRYLSQVYAMMASSLRGLVSPANVTGSLGTSSSVLATEPVAVASETS